MTETRKPNLTERIQTIKDSLGATSLAYKKWTQDEEKQANTRNLSHQTFRNTAITAGSLAGEIIDVLDELGAKILKVNENAKRERDGYVAEKKEGSTTPASKKLSVGTDFNSDVLTAVLPEVTEK